MGIVGLWFWVLMTIIVSLGIATIVAIAYYLYEQYQIQWRGMEEKDVKFKDFAYDSGINLLGCLILLVLLVYVLAYVLAKLYERHILNRWWQDYFRKPISPLVVGSPE